MDTLKISNLSKSYGSVQALDNVSFDINKGMYGLLGPNGAGKTTLMRTLTTLMPIEKVVDLMEIYYGIMKTKLEKLIGYLPQHFSMYSNITVEEALKYIATLKNVKDSEIDSQIQFALEKTNLLDEKNKKIKSYQVVW